MDHLLAILRSLNLLLLIILQYYKSRWRFRWQLSRHYTRRRRSFGLKVTFEQDQSTVVRRIVKWNSEVRSNVWRWHSTLDDSGHIPPIYFLSNSTTCVIKTLKNNFYTLFAFNSQRAYRPDGVAPIVHKNCALVLRSCLVKLLNFYLLLPIPFLSAGTMPVQFLCFRRETAPMSQTTVMRLCYVLNLEVILDRKFHMQQSTSDPPNY